MEHARALVRIGAGGCTNRHARAYLSENPLLHHPFHALLRLVSAYLEVALQTPIKR